MGLGVVLGIYFVVRWQVENNTIAEDDALIQKIAFEEDDEYNTEELSDEDISESQPENSQQNDKNTIQSLYYSYIKSDISNINFNNLKSINPQTIAWIKVNGTNINYPIVQTNNNEYYLTHSFENRKNSSGWVFMDYENKSDFSDRNTIIYAHGRNEGTMFGTLKKALGESWRKVADNRYIRVIVEGKTLLFETFSTYTTEPTSDYIQVHFASNDHFSKFLTAALKNSNFNYGVNVTPEDKVLTLSTCYGASDRMVLHAKLVSSMDN